MRNSSRKLIVFITLLFILTASNTGNAKNGKPSKKDNNFTNLKSDKKNIDINKTTASKSIPQISSPPISFEENKGQTDKSVKFLSRGKGFDLFLSANETVYIMPDAKCNQRRKDSNKHNSTPCRMLSLQMKMVNANADSLIQGIDETVTKTGYFLGNDSTKWLDDINNYRAVRYEKIYQGIDAVFRGTAQNLEYDFHIAPEADARLIQLEFSGAEKIKIDSNGDAIFKFEGAEVRHNKPFAYQIISGERREVSAKFISLGKNKIGFAVGEYDKTNELIIDPVVYATYLSDLGASSTEGIAIDSAGYIYTVSYGGTNKLNMLVTKLNPEGTEAIRNVVIGGSDDDIGWAIDIDGSGNVYIGGQTSSLDFPMVNARQTRSSVRAGEYGNSGVEGFVLKLNSSLDTLLYSTYHGATSARNGYDEDWVYSIDVDASGNLYAVGATGGTDFPLVNGYRMTRNATDFDAYLSKFSPTGELLYSTLFGSIQAYTWAFGNDVAVDNYGFAYLSGEISATSQMPVTPGAYKSGGTKGYVAKFNTNNSGSSSLVYATYTESTGQAIEIDQYGNAISIGSGSRYTPGYGVKLNSTGTAAIFKINIQGGVGDIAINKAGNIYFAQAVNVVENNQISYDVKVVGYGPAGNLLDETVIKGEYQDSPNGIALDSSNKIWVVGYTISKYFPTTEESLQQNSHLNVYGNAPYQGFLAKVDFGLPPTPPRNPLVFIPGTMGSEIRGNWNGIDVPFWVNVNPIATRRLPSVYNLTLDVNSPYYTEGLYASDVLQIGLSGVYKPLIESLKGKDYKPYDISRHLLSIQGCDESQKNSDSNLNPSLFVFPYDFRQDNNQTADKLKEYIQCVQKFYPPGTKVDILAHSQGGLVARQYILQAKSRNEPHGLGKVITIATPWLGAPEGTYRLYTGGDWSWFSFVVSPPTVKFLTPYFPGMHQLLPSRKYQELEGYIVAEGGDVNGNGIPDEIYSFPQNISQLNIDFPNKTPGTTGAEFHDVAGQDDWSADQSDIEYYHIVAEQNQLLTTHGLAVTKSAQCRWFGTSTSSGRCYQDRLYIPEKGFGDKTVATISASRYKQTANGIIDLNAPTAKWYLWQSPSDDDDDEEFAEHNGIHKNPRTHELIAYLLGVSPKPEINLPSSANRAISTEKNKLQSFEVNSLSQQGRFSEYGNGQYPAPPNLLNYSPSRYLTIIGKTEVIVRDEIGNIASIQNGLLDNQVKGLSNYEFTGENSIMLTLAVGHSYTIEFPAGETAMAIDLVEGRGNLQPTQATRYKDLDIPANSNVKLSIPQSSAVELKYDADNDGNFETFIPPTVSVSGAVASDTTLPTVKINVVQQGNAATATVTAQDSQSGISRIWYSLDGQNFQIYTASLTIQYSPTPIKIYSFADDAVANRSGLYSKVFTFPQIINPMVSITAPPSGLVFPIGTSINFTGNFSNDQCNTHIAAWNFDNIYQTGTVNESTREVIKNYTFTSAGVYLVTLTVNNACGGTGSANTVDGLTAMVVIYDPDGGFVTGGGWIDSPLGAYTTNPGLTGKASFGFNSKYQKGATVPTGNTEFQFRVANFNFKSTSYDWLVVGGAKAQYKGSGTINGSGNYGFMLTAIDGQINGGGGTDKFRIKIWDKATDNVVYDNQIGTPDNENPATAIGGGNIIIHKQ